MKLVNSVRSLKGFWTLLVPVLVVLAPIAIEINRPNRKELAVYHARQAEYPAKLADHHVEVAAHHQREADASGESSR
jgi:hypothetical protein